MRSGFTWSELLLKELLVVVLVVALWWLVS